VRPLLRLASVRIGLPVPRRRMQPANERSAYNYKRSKDEHNDLQVCGREPGVRSVLRLAGVRYGLPVRRRLLRVDSAPTGRARQLLSADVSADDVPVSSNKWGMARQLLAGQRGAVHESGPGGPVGGALRHARALLSAEIVVDARGAVRPGRKMMEDPMLDPDAATGISSISLYCIRLGSCTPNNLAQCLQLSLSTTL